MGAGAEGHRRVDADDRTGFRLRRDGAGGDDEERTANGDGCVMLLPGRHPVLIVEGVRDRLGKIGDLAHVPEGFRQLLPV